MRLNRYNWQDLESGGQVDPAWLPELLVSRRDSAKPVADEAGLGLLWEEGDSRVVLVEQELGAALPANTNVRCPSVL